MPAIMQAGGWRSETTVARYTARETAARGTVARFYEQEGEAATGQGPDQDPDRRIDEIAALSLAASRLPLAQAAGVPLP